MTPICINQDLIQYGKWNWKPVVSLKDRYLNTKKENQIFLSLKIKQCKPQITLLCTRHHLIQNRVSRHRIRQHPFRKSKGLSKYSKWLNIWKIKLARVYKRIVEKMTNLITPNKETGRGIYRAIIKLTGQFKWGEVILKGGRMGEVGD